MIADLIFSLIDLKCKMWIQTWNATKQTHLWAIQFDCEVSDSLSNEMSLWLVWCKWLSKDKIANVGHLGMLFSSSFEWFLSKHLEDILLCVCYVCEFVLFFFAKLSECSQFLKMSCYVLIVPHNKFNSGMFLLLSIFLTQLLLFRWVLLWIESTYILHFTIL